MAYTRVKICGITRVEDALQAAAEGVDAIGLVFCDKSPRAIDCQRAGEICTALPAFVTTVALFMDADGEQVADVLQQVPVDLLQFHGSEAPAFCRSFDRPYIKALGMLGEERAVERAAAYTDARGILLDGHAPGAAGGTGQQFDWTLAPVKLEQPLILAGGLDESNVAEAIALLSPWAVDVSSGVERDKGIKDAGRMRAFMNQVRQANKRER